MANYVSKDGLLYFWTLLKTKLDGKSNTGHKHTASDVTDFSTEVAKVKVTSASTADSANSVTWGNVSGKPDAYTPDTHTHATSDVTALTGYSKANSASAITASDSLNAAIGKLEKALDGKQASGSYQASGTYVTASSATTVETTLSTTSDVKVPSSKAVATYVTGRGYLTASSTAVTGKADKSTTLSGYGITDAYTKTEIDNKLTSAMRYKGSVATYAALPTENLTIGDMYNITATGANYVWDGSTWDETGTVVDLSLYMLSADLVAVTNTEIDNIVNPAS